MLSIECVSQHLILAHVHRKTETSWFDKVERGQGR